MQYKLGTHIVWCTTIQCSNFTIQTVKGPWAIASLASPIGGVDCNKKGSYWSTGDTSNTHRNQGNTLNTKLSASEMTLLSLWCKASFKKLTFSNTSLIIHYCTTKRYIGSLSWHKLYCHRKIWAVVFLYELHLFHGHHDD